MVDVCLYLVSFTFQTNLAAPTNKSEIKTLFLAKANREKNLTLSVEMANYFNVCLHGVMQCQEAMQVFTYVEDQAAIVYFENRMYCFNMYVVFEWGNMCGDIYKGIYLYFQLEWRHFH